VKKLVEKILQKILERNKIEKKRKILQQKVLKNKKIELKKSKKQERDLLTTPTGEEQLAATSREARVLLAGAWGRFVRAASPHGPRSPRELRPLHTIIGEGRGTRSPGSHVRAAAPHGRGLVG
jgi:hypothetical protein